MVHVMTILHQVEKKVQSQLPMPGVEPGPLTRRGFKPRMSTYSIT